MFTSRARFKFTAAPELVVNSKVSARVQAAGHSDCTHIPAMKMTCFRAIQDGVERQGCVKGAGLLTPASLGPKPTFEQVQGLVDQIQKVAKNVIPISVVANPSQIAGLRVPVGTKPSGALIDGRVYLFADNLRSTGDAYVTLFHELFHLGLQKVIPAGDCAALADGHPRTRCFTASLQPQIEAEQAHHRARSRHR